jgi:sugar O-acyltransferase (sialic acid O-acetyltransferase NeuD family)
MTEDLVIVGCGGHGREALDVVRAINRECAGGQRWRVIGFVDDKPSALNRERLDKCGMPLLGPVDWIGDAPPDTRFVIGIGDPRARRAVDLRMTQYGLHAARLVHPAATVGPDTAAGAGLLVFAGARVTTNVVLGRHVHLNQNVTVGHDCRVGDYVSVNPLAAVSGDCRVESGVLIGTTAAVLQGLHIGTDATVGAGACVVRDVAARTVVKGVPAR